MAGVEGYDLSSDPARVDRDRVWRYLHDEAYWSKGVSREVFERSLAHSIVFGIYREGAQAAFGRVVTDRATFAWLADVVVFEEHRHQGLARWLVQSVLSHPDLAGVRRVMLATADAHALYRECGFTALPAPERFMEHRPG